MVIKTELADGTFEVFESQGYNISTKKDMHPMIVSVEIFDNGNLIFKISRFWKWYYKHFTFKSAKIQNQLKDIERVKNAEKSL